MRLNKTGGAALFTVFALGARSALRAYTPPAEREVENQRQRDYFIDTVNHSGSQSGETAYCFHSLSGDVDYGICQLTLMPATLHVVERDENCESSKT